MTKKIIFGIFAVTLVVVGYAFRTEAITYGKNVFAVMQSERGNEVLHPGAMLKDYSRFSSVTEALICTGKCAIFDVIMTSGADGAYAVISDTTAVNGTGAAIVGKMEFDGTGIPKSLAAGNPNAFPIVTKLGITADLSSVAAGEEILIIYKDLD
jgi:hypothetical protein